MEAHDVNLKLLRAQGIWSKQRAVVYGAVGPETLQCYGSAALGRGKLENRKSDPLKRWKVSPIDDLAITNWKAYSQARNEMLARTHNPTTPWTLVRANDKRLARLNIIKDVLSRLHYTDKDKRLIRPDLQIVFSYDVSNLENGQLAR